MEPTRREQIIAELGVLDRKRHHLRELASNHLDAYNESMSRLTLLFDQYAGLEKELGDME